MTRTARSIPVETWVTGIAGAVMLAILAGFIVWDSVMAVQGWPCWVRACTHAEQCAHHYVYDRSPCP